MADSDVDLVVELDPDAHIAPGALERRLTELVGRPADLPPEPIERPAREDPITPCGPGRPDLLARTLTRPSDQQRIAFRAELHEHRLLQDGRRWREGSDPEQCAARRCG